DDTTFTLHCGSSAIIISGARSKWRGLHRHRGVIMPRIRKQRLGRGQGLVTYALLLALVAIVVIVVIAALGDVIGATFCSVTYALMGANMPEIDYCETPRISCVGVANGATVSGPISLEAVVDDIRGPDNIQQVDFYVNDTLYRTEYISR